MDEQRLLDLYIRESFYKSSSHSDVARFLRAGNDINATDDNGNNALFQCRTPEAMVSLISNGINIHHINDAGQHALFHQKDPELLKRLISLGLDLMQTDIHGRNCIYGHFSSPESLEVLLNAGCVNATICDRYLPFSCPLDAFFNDAVRFPPFHRH